MKRVIESICRVLPIAFITALAAVPMSGSDACIPLANGVPGTVTFTHPPNWFDPTPGPPLYNTAVDAPSWRGALGYGYPLGTATPAQLHFRALHRTDAGVEYLYLSWFGGVIPSLTANNALWVGFHDDAGAGQDVAIGITITGAAIDMTDSPTGYTATVVVKPNGSADNAWVSYTGPPSVPAWLSGTARLWITTTPKTWAMNIRVPITGTNDLNNGVRISTPFKMWYEFQAGTADLVTFPNGYIPYKFPRAVPDMAFSPAPVGQWGEVRLTMGTPESPDPQCPSNGVSLRDDDIGSTNADPDKINLTTPNTLFAKPNNGMATDVTLSARFRLANWGAGATWEDVPNPNATLWTPIGTSTATSITHGTKGNLTIAYTATQCEACQYQTYYATHKAFCDANCPAGTNNTKRDHQCLLVELNGAADYINDSAYTNMNFADTSEYTEVADVNLAGLPETAPGSLARDVYFYIATTNMPAHVTPPPPGTAQQRERNQYSILTDPNRTKGEKRAAAEQLLNSGRATYEDLQNILPTYIVYAYYDTGERRTRGSQTVAVLHPLNGFGYFALHQGTPEGWTYDLKDAEKIAPDWYRIHVGPSGVATVRPVIEAIDRRGYSFFIDLGPNFPHGQFSSGTDGKWSLNTGIERFLTANWSLEGILGYHRFDAPPVSNPHIWQLSIGAKRYFGTAPWHPFIDASVGAYRFDPGSTTKAGGNVGGGVLYDMSSKWGIEGVYQYHSVHLSGLNANFSTLQGGVRVRF